MSAFEKLAKIIRNLGLHTTANYTGKQVFISTVHRTFTLGEWVVTDAVSLAVQYSNWLDVVGDDDAAEAMLAAIEEVAVANETWSV